jgi:DNA-binding MarR family transcriptional regulator
MSTKFPTQARDVPLTLLLHLAQDRLSAALLARLSPLAPGLQPPHLALFAALDCGATHAASAADRLGISRQAVARTAREMEEMGLLTLVADSTARNRNLLVMTPAGEALAREGRAALEDMETGLDALAGPLRAALQTLADR